MGGVWGVGGVWEECGVWEEYGRNVKSVGCGRIVRSVRCGRIVRSMEGMYMSLKRFLEASYFGTMYPWYWLNRLDKLREVLETTETYSTLGLSHIEGIETLHNRFQLLLSNLKKKPYNPLEQRKTEFDGDFEDFKRQALDIKVSVSPLLPFARNGESK